MIYFKCCFTYSQIIMAPVTWTFKLRIIPCWGISTQQSKSCINSTGIPSFSFPRKITDFSGNWNSLSFVLSEVCSIPMILYPFDLASSKYSLSPSILTSIVSIHWWAALGKWKYLIGGYAPSIVVLAAF